MLWPQPTDRGPHYRWSDMAHHGGILSERPYALPEGYAKQRVSPPQRNSLGRLAGERLTEPRLFLDPLHPRQRQGRWRGTRDPRPTIQAW
jgi:hypothetical protein